MATGFYLLTFGVLLIYGFHRVTGWLHARGWIRWKVRRGTSSGLGNAVLGAQMIFQPQIRDVLEVRLDERGETGESGDPPDPGAHDGRITSDEFYDEPSVHVAEIRVSDGEVLHAPQLREGQQVEYGCHIQPGPDGPRSSLPTSSSSLDLPVNSEPGT